MSVPHRWWVPSLWDACVGRGLPPVRKRPLSFPAELPFMHDQHHRVDNAPAAAGRARARGLSERGQSLSGPTPAAPRAGLTRAQRAALEVLECFRWRLAFVRRPAFAAAIPVLFHRDGTRWLVIREDGSLDETPTLRLRR